VAKIIKKIKEENELVDKYVEEILNKQKQTKRFNKMIIFKFFFFRNFID